MDPNSEESLIHCAQNLAGDVTHTSLTANTDTSILGRCRPVMAHNDLPQP